MKGPEPMFTGIIEAVGRIRRVSRLRLETSIPRAWDLAAGESVAVDGVCLTALEHEKGAALFDLSGETFERTAFGSLRSGSPVNLERAMKADGRFSGHFVTGHVDGVTRLLEVKRISGGFELAVGAPPAAVLVEKGSVALNGVSLTVYGVGASSFRSAVIPHTWAHTALGRLRPGDPLNIEYDILGKYARKGRSSGVTTEFLSENGFF